MVRRSRLELPRVSRHPKKFNEVEAPFPRYAYHTRMQSAPALADVPHPLVDHADDVAAPLVCPVVVEVERLGVRQPRLRQDVLKR